MGLKSIHSADNPCHPRAKDRGGKGGGGRRVGGTRNRGVKGWRGEEQRGRTRVTPQGCPMIHPLEMEWGGG